MRIVTWNVNGIRAALRKGALDWVQAESPEIVCLQEVRAQSEQIDGADLERLQSLYNHQTWYPANRAGYSGVATFTSIEPIETSLGLDAPAFDDEGRVIISRLPGFLLFNIYFPNGGRDHARVPFKLDFYAHLLDFCDRLHAQGEMIVLTGDFNTAHQEIDLRNPKSNENTTGFLPEERVWIDRYLEHGFVDAFRELYPDKVQYTWWTYRSNARARNVGWRLDYYLVSKPMMVHVKEVQIHDEVLGSDHCPVSLILNNNP
jgi:exodeoxyribonuclease-3